MMIPALAIATLPYISCKKDKPVPEDQHFDLDVSLRSSGTGTGKLVFRQDPDVEKIIDLSVTVSNLAPNRQYLFQRAVDAVNMVDGNCTSSAWLTLGKGLTPQSIITDDKGNDEVKLWRDVTALSSGSKFDIHFQVIDAVTLAVVLTSDCYYYQVR